MQFTSACFEIEVTNTGRSKNNAVTRKIPRKKSYNDTFNLSIRLTLLSFVELLRQSDLW